MGAKPDSIDKITKVRLREELKVYEDLQPADYLQDRLIFKIQLYFKLSRRCEKAYRFSAFSTLCFGALVPVVMNWNYLKGYSIGHETDLGTFLATVFSIIVIILVSLETTFHFRERLQNYKKTEDQLTHELYIYQSGSEPYNLRDPIKERENFHLLVLRVEAIIREERADTIEKATAQVIEKNKLEQ